MSPRSTTTTRPKTSSPIISKVISVATPIKVSKSTSTHHALTSSKSTSKSTSTHDAPKSSKSTSTTPKQTVKIPSYVNLYKPAQLSTACRCLSMPPRKTVTSTAKVTPTITQVYLVSLLDPLTAPKFDLLLTWGGKQVAYTTTMTPYTVKTSTSTSTHHACPTTVR